jgi:hypothetical protein
MTTTRRHQRRYDHRLRDLVRRAGDVTIATDVGIPRSTARGWLAKAPNVVVSLDVTNLNASELEQEVLVLRRRVKTLRALLRLALALLRSCRSTLTHEHLPEGRAKTRILRAVDRTRAFVPLRALLRFLTDGSSATGSGMDRGLRRAMFVVVGQAKVRDCTIVPPVGGGTGRETGEFLLSAKCPTPRPTWLRTPGSRL